MVGTTPTVLGRYEVVKHLASGGMAEVLLARTPDGNGGVAHVVLKRIRPDQATDARFVEMFLDEARIAAYLQHPNIVRVFDIGQDKAEFFFAMEYVHGEDLRKVLMEVHRRRDQLPIAMVSSIVAGAAAGLHHAHVKLGPDGKPLHIVHRDVSPANILIGYDGSVKVADFGIAKAALRTVETRSGTLKGKVSYMSPEQVTGKPVDRRSDVFALGIVLYEVATARRLFKGENDFLTMSAIVQGNIPRPSQFRPDLPRVLEEIMMTSLALEPGERFQSTDELRMALETFMSSLGMRIAPHAIADYMKKLFGLRAEPWLVDDEPTMTTSIDFDGSASGVVQPSDGALRDHALPPSLRPSASAPIVHARSELAGPLPADQLGPADLAWNTEPTPIRTRSRSRVVAIGLGATLAAAIGTVVVIKASASSKPEEAAKIEMTAEPAHADEPPRKGDSDVDTKTADDVGPEVQPTKADAKPATKADAKLATTTDTKPAAKADAKLATTDTKPAAKADTKPAAKADAKLATKTDAKLVTKPEVKADAKLATKTDAKLVTKPAAKADAKLAVKADTKPAAKADAKLVTKPDAKKADAPKTPVVAKKTPPVKKPVEKKPPAKQPAGQWDPNALFAPK